MGISTIVASMLVHPVRFAQKVGDDIKVLNEKHAAEAEAKASRSTSPLDSMSEKQLQEELRRRAAARQG